MAVDALANAVKKWTDEREQIKVLSTYSPGVLRLDSLFLSDLKKRPGQIQKDSAQLTAAVFTEGENGEFFRIVLAVTEKSLIKALNRLIAALKYWNDSDSDEFSAAAYFKLALGPSLDLMAQSLPMAVVGDSFKVSKLLIHVFRIGALHYYDGESNWADFSFQSQLVEILAELVSLPAIPPQLEGISVPYESRNSVNCLPMNVPGSVPKKLWSDTESTICPACYLNFTGAGYTDERDLERYFVCYCNVDRTGVKGSYSESATARASIVIRALQDLPGESAAHARVKQYSKDNCKSLFD